MPLPTSGPISLNQIHVEAGGTSGSLTRINDADNRGLINKAASVRMSFSEWRGASAEIPDPVRSARTSNQGNAIEGSAVDIPLSSTSNAASEICIEFNMRKITNGYEIRVRRVPVSGVAQGDGNARLFNTSNSSSDTPTTFTRFLIINNYAIDSYKMDWEVVNGSLGTDVDARYTDSNLKANDNVFYSDDNRYRIFRVFAASNTNAAVFRAVGLNIRFTARKSGVPDKDLGLYSVLLEAEAQRGDGENRV